ncbi:MAG: YcjF family protein, partial [Gammaproteobacteria bacterium]|nr:YcjF family protein [Gammaproteobacteria bacterium]
VADLFAAAFVDGAMIWHLSKLYDLPLGRGEAGSLAGTIITQLAALMGTVWAMHFVSSALKVGTAGMSTVVTAGAQGAVAYYATFVVGKVAERYLVQGKSWGDGGPKQVVQEILDSIDRDSILSEARADIKAHLRGTRS